MRGEPPAALAGGLLYFCTTKRGQGAQWDGPTAGSQIPNGNRVPGGIKKMRANLRTLRRRAFSPLVWQRRSQHDWQIIQIAVRVVMQGVAVGAGGRAGGRSMIPSTRAAGHFAARRRLIYHRSYQPLFWSLYQVSISGSSEEVLSRLQL